MSNEVVMMRLKETLGRGLLAGYQASVRFVHRELVKATPKLTGFASGWQVGLGGAPPIVPGQPKLPRYPLYGDDTVDKVMAQATLGDDAVMVSRAIYIAELEAGKSRQQPQGFIPDSIERARQNLEAWRWQGAA